MARFSINRVEHALEQMAADDIAAGDAIMAELAAFDQVFLLLLPFF